MDVVILAGGKCGPELKQTSGVECRADIEIGGKTLVQTVLEAVAPLGEPVLVGGPKAEGTRQVPGGDDFCESLANGLKCVSTEKFLLVTVDLPCLTTESLRDFVARCDQGAGLNYPIVERAACEREFPGMKRTTLKLREGEFTGGNVAMMDAAMMRRAMPVVQNAYEQRKRPLKLALMLGPGVLLRVLAGQVVPAMLPLSALERAVGGFLGVPVRSVTSNYAEIAADLDSADQYRAFRDLKNRGN